MGCCGDEVPVQYRYSDEGVLQRSEDGGATWTDAPEYDTRVYSPQFPPMSGTDGADKRCIAATGMVTLIKEQVGDQLTDDMSRYTLGQLITDWVTTMIQTSNPFQALVTVITNQIFALVIATLRPALTETVYDTLLCIFYCNMGDDATFNLEQWQAVRADITDQIGGIAGIFLEHLVYLLGTTGLTNLARAGGAAEGDCSDCPSCEPGCENDWIVYPNSPNYFGIMVEQTSTYMIVKTDVINTNGLYYTYLRAADNEHCCVIGHVTYMLHTTDESLMTYENFIENGDQITNFGGVCGSAIPTEALGPHTTDDCMNQVQNQSAAPFAMMYTKDAC